MIIRCMTATRPFAAATLLACLGLPMSACAQAQEVQAGADVAADQAEGIVESAPDTPVATAEVTEEPQKTPEEVAAEKEQKELEQLQRAAQLRAAKLAAELAPLNEKKQRIEAEVALLQAKQMETQAQAKMNLEQADFRNQIELAEMQRKIQRMQQRLQQMQTESQIKNLEQQNKTAKITAQSAELQAENAKLAAKTAALQAEINLVWTKRDAASIDQDEMQYPGKPLKDGVLTISDRRIPLNDVISFGTADFVTERIHYFNNLDEKAPIFIVIDRCPGGSVMEGYRIVTAMQNSKAPVHVVVKQYAASMAAVITTLAEESYAYPNAIILHHQMSSGMRGNLTQQKESLEEGFEWAKRLADPVAEKMGVDYDKFTKLMYENNSDGDWAEFADKAKELKWVNNVVEEIRELSLTTAPTSTNISFAFFQADTPEQATSPRALTQEELFRTPSATKVKTDGNGNTYYELPPLSPYDYYFLHNPEGRYRVAK